jgi:hypothetical protein
LTLKSNLFSLACLLRGVFLCSYNVPYIVIIREHLDRRQGVLKVMPLSSKGLVDSAQLLVISVLS